MRTPERVVKDEVEKILKEQGVFYWMPVTTMYGRKGISDFICCVDGQFLAIETKRDDHEKPTKLQEQFISEVRMAKGVALVIHKDNIDQVRDTISALRLGWFT